MWRLKKQLVYHGLKTTGYIAIARESDLPEATQYSKLTSVRPFHNRLHVFSLLYLFSH